MMFYWKKGSENFPLFNRHSGFIQNDYLRQEIKQGQLSWMQKELYWIFMFPDASLFLSRHFFCERWRNDEESQKKVYHRIKRWRRTPLFESLYVFVNFRSFEFFEHFLDGWKYAPFLQLYDFTNSNEVTCEKIRKNREIIFYHFPPFRFPCVLGAWGKSKSALVPNFSSKSLYLK